VRKITSLEMRVPEQTAALATDQETPPDIALTDLPRLFPLVLPLPGALLPGDVAAWEQRVRDAFRRLDALADELVNESSWLRLAPWCAAAGVMVAVLEITRRHLGQRPPPGLFEAAGRSLAWHWPSAPEDDAEES
jgi:hypothetical protein